MLSAYFFKASASISLFLLVILFIRPGKPSPPVYMKGCLRSSIVGMTIFLTFSLGGSQCKIVLLVTIAVGTPYMPFPI